MEMIVIVAVIKTFQITVRFSVNGLLFSYLTITDVTSYVHHKFPGSFLLFITTRKGKQIIAANSSKKCSYHKI